MRTLHRRGACAPHPPFPFLFAAAAAAELEIDRNGGQVVGVVSAVAADDSGPVVTPAVAEGHMAHECLDPAERPRDVAELRFI